MLLIRAYYPPKLFHNMQLEISEFSQIESWKLQEIYNQKIPELPQPKP